METDTPLHTVDSTEVSVVMPCLNEADTVAVCVAKALRTINEFGIVGEVIIADNGSVDGSQRLAAKAGARIVHATTIGYGAALMAGIEAAQGKFVIMGDADESYDFLDLERFVLKLRDGYDIVQGCRLPRGGGKILKGAMPFLHRWWGNPMFTQLARWWFRVPIHDIYCGLRGFRRDWQLGLQQRCTGMEFATEMLIKASLTGARIGEVPITLHPDGRKAHAPHLKTFRDGWRTLRFFLLCTPRWVFLVPGSMLVASGLLGYGLALPGVTLFGATFDAHTLLFASLAVLCGYQAVVFAIFSKTVAQKDGILPPDPRLLKFFHIVTLERGLMVAGAALFLGTLLLLTAIHRWWLAGFGPLDYAETMRLVIPGVTIFALGFQTVMVSFLVSMVGIDRK